MKKISRILEIISGVFFLACGGYVILNILIRTIFNHPLTGVYEMTGLFAVVFASCSLLICIIEDGNVLVDVVIDKMGAKGRLFFKYFAHLIDLLYYAVLAWGAWRIGIAKLLGSELTTTAKSPIGPFRVFWAVAATLIVFIKPFIIAWTKCEFEAAEKRKAELAAEEAQREEAEK